MYADRTAELANAQASGAITRGIDPDLLNILLLGVAGYWSMLPRVTRMISGRDEAEDHDRRRAAVIEAARRLATP